VGPRRTRSAELRLPWTLATLKDDLHVVGRQGSVTDQFTDQVTTATISYLDNSEGSDSA
jgi:hypothetical protein